MLKHLKTLWKFIGRKEEADVSTEGEIAARFYDDVSVVILDRIMPAVRLSLDNDVWPRIQPESVGVSRDILTAKVMEHAAEYRGSSEADLIRFCVSICRPFYEETVAPLKNNVFPFFLRRAA